MSTIATAIVARTPSMGVRFTQGKTVVSVEIERTRVSFTVTGPVTTAE
ncbi:hypothetical protein [Acidisarcina polymorpha]|nr:hypothetical protein [Acidisarcina polymorpha]